MIFSRKQITRAHHLFIDHNYTVEQVADVMNCNIPSARHLLKLVKEAAGIKQQQTRTTIFDRPEPKPVIDRPPTQYSNKNFWEEE